MGEGVCILIDELFFNATWKIFNWYRWQCCIGIATRVLTFHCVFPLFQLLILQRLQFLHTQTICWLWWGKAWNFFFFCFFLSLGQYKKLCWICLLWCVFVFCFFFITSILFAALARTWSCLSLRGWNCHRVNEDIQFASILLQMRVWVNTVHAA